MTGTFLKIDNLPNVDFHSCEEQANDITVTRRLQGVSAPGVSYEALRKLRDNKIKGTNTFGTSDYGYFKDYSIQAGVDNGKGGRYDIITIETIDLVLDLKNGYYSNFTATNRTNAEPLEAKRQREDGSSDEDYKTWWNYETRGEEGISYSEADTTAIKAVDDGIMPSTQADKGLYFAKTNQARKKGEKIYLASKENKRGRQSFLFPHLTVQENIYARSESTVKVTLDAIGYLKYPENHAGTPYDSTKVDNSNWLIIDAKYRKVFGWYEATVSYRYSPEPWDEDLYPEV